MLQVGDWPCGVVTGQAVLWRPWHRPRAHWVTSESPVVADEGLEAIHSVIMY